VNARFRDKAIGDFPITAPKPADWSRTNGTYIAGRAYLDEADQTAADMEGKWGAGRLRLLVTPEMREKFDRQRYLLNQAVWHGELKAVRREAMRMVTAWLALDKLAAAAGRKPLEPNVWEIALEDGTVAALVPSPEHGRTLERDGRKMVVYTLDELARILTHWKDVAAVKLAFPGATVEAVRRTIPDPLDAVHDTGADLDDEIPF
jgi:hypothetical protein